MRTQDASVTSTNGVAAEARRTLLQRCGAEPWGRAADLHQVAQYPVHLEGIGNDGEDLHLVAAGVTDKGIFPIDLARDQGAVWPTSKHILVL